MVEAGVTLIVAVAPPVLQAYPVPPVAVNATVAPLQMIPSLFAAPEVSETVIPGVGSALTTSVVFAEGRQAGLMCVGVSIA